MKTFELTKDFYNYKKGQQFEVEDNAHSIPLKYEETLNLKIDSSLLKEIRNRNYEVLSPTSIKRLSDNEIFSVGDKINGKSINNIIINDISILDNNQLFFNYKDEGILLEYAIKQIEKRVEVEVSKPLKYKILSFQLTSHPDRFVNLRENELYSYNETLELGMPLKRCLEFVNSGFYIPYQIQRLSDNEIFTIGDTIRNKISNKTFDVIHMNNFYPLTFITNFNLRLTTENFIEEVIVKRSLNDEELYPFYLENLNKEDFLILTEDNYPIGNGDEYYTIFTKSSKTYKEEIEVKEEEILPYTIYGPYKINNQINYFLGEECKFFYKKDNGETFIKESLEKLLNNNKCFSINILKEILPINTIMENKLKRYSKGNLLELKEIY